MSISTEKQNKWVSLCKSWKERWPVYSIENDNIEFSIDIYDFIESLNTVMTKDNIIVTDAGSPSYALPQNLKCKIDQKFIFSAAQADMGFSVPGSIGVAKANPDKHIIVVTGDGSFNSNLQELAVIKYHNLPISIFILDNNGYLSIKNTQRKFFDNRIYGVSPQTGILLADIYKTAKLYNLDYYLIDKKNTMQDMISDIIRSSEPKLVRVVCKENQEIIPTQMFKMIDGKKVQPGLDDMYPFLTDEEYLEEKRKALSI